MVGQGKQKKRIGGAYSHTSLKVCYSNMMWETDKCNTMMCATCIMVLFLS